MNDKSKTAMEIAMDDYRKNARFRALVTAVAAEVMQSIPGDLRDAMSEVDLLEDIGNIALKTAALMLTRIYQDDYELNEQKAMAEQYRKLAENMLLTHHHSPSFTARALS